MRNEKVRVLLVEDDEDDYRLTRDAVESIGEAHSEIVWCSGFDEARDALTEQSFDVALISDRIGPKTGIEFLKAAKADGFDAPAILLTDHQDREMETAAGEAGVFDQLDKAELAPAVVERAIRIARANAATPRAPAERTVADRRFLPRANPGRRAGDTNTAGGIGVANELSDAEAEARPLLHLFLVLLFSIAGLGLIWFGNARFAPLLFDVAAVEQVAATLASGSNYATFDLNINSRALRRAHIANLTETPDVAVMGASHWQEAHASLVPGRYFYNAHVHRDYYEDMLAVVEMFVSNNRLPKQLIITIRDNLFTPVADRTDFLWMPAIPDYREMAKRLKLPTHPWAETIPLPQIREGFSLANLHANAKRWFGAWVRPHETNVGKLETLDILLADGSISWSRRHDMLFTPASAREKALSFADQRRNDPPRIDPDGIVAIDRLLAFLRDRDVEVILAHPPFNPIFYDTLQGSPYMEGLERVKALTRYLAKKYRLHIIGSFNPHDLGCGAELYIDAEHANPKCLQKILDQYVALDLSVRSSSAPVN